jgi:two-component system, cell cycle response regulator CpdR
MKSAEIAVDILLVEDDELVLDILGEALDLAGLDTARHTTAESALKEITRAAPNFVVTDINLGAGMDGLELGRTARAQFPNLPVVYISGRYPEVRGLTEFERFLLKPFPAALLLRTIDDLRASVALGAV